MPMPPMSKRCHKGDTAAGSQLGSMCECGRRASRWTGLTPEFHGCDKTAVHSENVENFAVR